MYFLNSTINNKNRFFNILEAFEPYYVIFIVINGLVGNTISFLMFKFTKLKSNPANMLLAGLAVADNWFLASLLIVTLRHFSFNIVDESELACKLTAYSTFVSSFLSAWFIGLFSIQRFIVVYFPFKKYILCNKSKTKLFITLIVTFSLLFYSITLVSAGFDKREDNGCLIKQNWLTIFKVLNFIDTIQTMALPFFIISISNILIGFRLMTEGKKLKDSGSFRIALFKFIPLNKNSEQSDLQSFTSNLNSNSTRTTFEKRNSLCQLQRRITLKEVKKHNSKSNKETTKILLIIASTFLILNFPLAATKTYYFFASSKTSSQSSSPISSSTVLPNSQNDSTISNNGTVSKVINENGDKTTKEIIEKVAQFIYYINYSTNFFLYTFNTKQFRENFLNSIRKKL